MQHRVRFWVLGALLLGILTACAQASPSGPQPTAPAAVSTPAPARTPGLPAVEPTLIPTEAGPAPAILESRRLTVELPTKIRAGDGDVIRMTLEMDELGNITPTAQIGGHDVTGTVVKIPNLYETHNVLAEARLDLAGAQVTPAETVSEPLRPGQRVTFFWSVRVTDPGTYKGVIWLYMRYIPKDGGAEARETISAQLFELEGVSLLGLKASPARWLGLAGSFLGTVLGFPFLEDILRWLWKRRK